jgi:NADPH:quinone reductase-like Zn-dependent oxidoreductase
MKAIRVHQFGGFDALVYEDVGQPVPAEGQVLIRVEAAGVGPWDAWVRSGTSKVQQQLPLTPGADLAGVVESAGMEVPFLRGDEVYGITNGEFVGAYTEYAVATATMLARKPATIGFVEAASVPVVASTAWQMLFEHGTVDSTKRVLVHGGAGNVGAYAVQMARDVAREVIATALPEDVDYVRSLGAHQVIDVKSMPFESAAKELDVVIDTVGGETLVRSFAVLKPGGVLVSSVSVPDQELAARHQVRAVFFLVKVTTEGLTHIASMIDEGRLSTCVGEVLALRDARVAHEMLAGRPHRRGKIILRPTDENGH